MTDLPAAVLWDMDGTIVDTEPYWMAEEHALVEEYGGTWTEEHGLALVGNPLEASAQYILDHSPVALTVTAIVDRLSAGVIDRVRREAPWRPGARELLAELNALGVPCALVTMSWTDLAGAVVSALPPDTFSAVVTGDVVQHGKPHPEPYQTAARLLGVPASGCVALEDSPTGVRSAVAAGVPTIAIPHVVPIPTIPGAGRVAGLSGVRAADLVGLARG